MKAMLSAFAAAIIIAIGANFILGEAGFSASDQASGASVRLD